MNRNLIITAIIISVSALLSEMRAEDLPKYNNIFVELCNGTNLVSINYDTRIKSGSNIGWRAGVGYSGAQFKNGGTNLSGNSATGISLPLGVNMLIGHNVSKLEIGFGVCPGLYHFQGRRDMHDDRSAWYEPDGPKRWRCSCAMNIDIGYRLQRKSGFNFRAGISPCIGINSSGVYVPIIVLIPYISLGYTIN